MSPPRRLLISHALLGLLFLGASRADAQAPLRGFPPDALAERARLEQMLRSTPDTARLREYMLAMSEEPHHGGSSASKTVAEYALAKFRSWGLDAEIEEFEALMPFPTIRRVELIMCRRPGECSVCGWRPTSGGLTSTCSMKPRRLVAACTPRYTAGR